MGRLHIFFGHYYQKMAFSFIYILVNCNFVSRAFHCRPYLISDMLVSQAHAIGINQLDIYFEHCGYRRRSCPGSFLAEDGAVLVHQPVRALEEARHQRRLAVEVRVLSVDVRQLDGYQVLHLCKQQMKR